MSNAYGKVMISTILNAFAGEKYPASQVNRTLRAIENVEEQFTKRDIKSDNMKALAKYMAAELKGEPVEDDTDETDTFVAQQQAFNDKVAKQLADISAKLDK